MVWRSIYGMGELFDWRRVHRREHHWGSEDDYGLSSLRVERLAARESVYLTVEVSASRDAPFVLDYVLGYQQPAPTPIGASSSSSSPSLPVGAIVGGLVGSIALLIIVVAILVCFLLRRQRRKLDWTGTCGAIGMSDELTHRKTPHSETS